MPNRPLEGIRIIDLTRLLPGPMCTLHLADMGADVIKVEDLYPGDYARTVPPVQKENSSFFLAVNRNKRSIKINLSKPAGRDVFIRFARTAQVIVESFRPGVTDKLNINYSAIKKINPGIIYCSITGYGQTGPYKNKAGHDLNFISLAGVIKKNPFGNHTPSIPNFQIADIAGGALNAATGILAALLHQKSTGKGQYIDVSIFDGVLAHSVTALSLLKASELSGTDASGMLNGALHCYSIYETKDSKHIALAALEFKFWERFCLAVGKTGLIQKQFTSSGESKKIRAELTALFKSKTLARWVDHFKDTDCCISPVLTMEEALKNKHVQARKMAITSRHPAEGDVLQFALPLKFSGFQFGIDKPAPLHGEHTTEVLESLGYSKNDIEQMRTEKII